VFKDQWILLAMGYGALNFTALMAGAADFRYLLEKGYPRARSLELVGNRYKLDRIHRQILHRGVFAVKICSQRKSHLELPERIRGKALAVDGYNVLITVESSMRGIPVLLCDDGWVRDVAGVSGGYRLEETGKRAIALILEAIRALGPKRVKFLFDSPIARSGELASLIREKIGHCNMVGDALAVPVPEKILLEHRGPVATSDSALIDRLPRVVDLAGFVIRRSQECGKLLELREDQG